MAERLKKLGREMAEAALEVAGPRPVNEDGKCILPTEPIVGDWDGLCEELGREPTREEWEEFREAYREALLEGRKVTARSHSWGGIEIRRVWEGEPLVGHIPEDQVEEDVEDQVEEWCRSRGWKLVWGLSDLSLHLPPEPEESEGETEESR